MFVYKLFIDKFLKLHLGKDEINDDLDIIHSDTLFSAIINCYLLIYGKDSVNIILAEFLNSRIKISSVFYFLDIFKNNILQNTIYFLPIPNFLLFRAGTNSNLEDIKFVSYNLFRELISNFYKERLTSKFDSEIIFISEEFCCAKSEIPSNFNFNMKQRIVELKTAINQKRYQTSTINNFSESNIILTNESQDELVIKPGMFFLANLQTKEHTKFDTSVKLMCDEGIGGKKSFGRGQFLSAEGQEFNYDTTFFETAGCQINLSLISPGNKELKKLDNTIIRYSSLVRGGWTPNNIKTKSIRMIKEGSVFNNKVNGKFVNIAPVKFKEHKIYRNGTGFYL